MHKDKKIHAIEYDNIRLLMAKHMKNIRGKVPWNKGKKLKSSWNKGKPCSKETKQKISESNLGKIAWNKGKHYTEKMKLKASINLKKYYETHTIWNKGKKGASPSEETKEKQAAVRHRRSMRVLYRKLYFLILIWYNNQEYCLKLR